MLEHLEATNGWLIQFIEELENAGIDFCALNEKGYDCMEQVEYLENWADANKELIKKLRGDKNERL